MSEALCPALRPVNMTALADEIARTADVARDLERIASEKFLNAPAEWQAMDMLVQRIEALRDYVYCLARNGGDAASAVDSVKLDELRSRLSGRSHAAPVPGDTELF